MEGQKTTLHVVVIATLLAAVALATPILVDRHAPDRANAAGSSRQQVELADIAVPAADGGDLECNSGTNYSDNYQRWNCGNGIVTAKAGMTTDDPRVGLARYVRGAVLEDKPDVEGVEKLGDGAHILTHDRPDGQIIAIAVPKKKSTVYFTFDSQELAQPLIDAIQDHTLEGMEAPDER